MLTLPPMAHPYSDTHTAHPQPPQGLGAAGVPAVRTQSWVQTGLLLVPRAVTLDRPVPLRASQAPHLHSGVFWRLLLGTPSGVGPLHTFRTCSHRRLGHTLGNARMSQGLGGAWNTAQRGWVCSGVQAKPPLVPALWDGHSERILTLSSHDTDCQGLPLDLGSGPRTSSVPLCWAVSEVAPGHSRILVTHPWGVPSPLGGRPV